MTAEQVIAALDLQPHPEGGHFRESYRHLAPDGGRGAMTAIYYLLRQGEISAWHRVNDADEIWHHYAGAALELSRCQPGSANGPYSRAGRSKSIEARTAPPVIKRQARAMLQVTGAKPNSTKIKVDSNGAA